MSRIPPGSRVRATFGIAVAFLLAACAQSAGPGSAVPGSAVRGSAVLGSADPGASSGPTTLPGATSTERITSAEPNVISGRVTTEPGDPIAGAQIRITGFTGGSSLGREIETVESGADGAYRYEVPRGLYHVRGQATIAFDGQSYLFDLEPADGRCEEQMSDDGIVKDLVLRLTGLKPCLRDAMPDSNRSYHGGSIQLFNKLTVSHSPDAEIEFTLEPNGPLADGTSGQALTMTRTVAALRTSFGPIDSTFVLYDVPLARYRLSAQLVKPDGERMPLFVSTTTPTPAAEVDITFDAEHFLGDPRVGYRIPQLSVYDP